MVAHTFEELRLPETDMAQEIKEQLVMATLPSRDEIRSRFASALRSRSPHVELVTTKRSHYKLWLASDVDGPGYSRQSAYGVVNMDSETPDALQGGGAVAERMVAKLKTDTFDAVTEFAVLVAERVSTFRAYNKLRSDDVVTIRSSADQLPNYLQIRGGGCLRVNLTSDEYMVRFGGYFFVCPPGEEHVPEPMP
jgi:hypothetical protein